MAVEMVGETTVWPRLGFKLYRYGTADLMTYTFYAQNPS
jgi:hypothetical protein